MNKRDTVTANLLNALSTSSRGMTTKDFNQSLNATTATEKAYIRQCLTRLAGKKKVLRVTDTRPGNIGPKPFVYFPASDIGRAGRDMFVADYGATKPHYKSAEASKRSYTRRTLTPPPTVYSTPSMPNGTNESRQMAQALVRIKLGDGEHDIPVSQAKVLFAELTDIFA